MRAIVTLLAIVVIVGIVGVATGFLKFSGTPGELPKVAVTGGSLPKVNAETGSIAVGTKDKTVEVPTVQVRKPE